jgi:hypothetical protein
MLNYGQQNNLALPRQTMNSGGGSTTTTTTGGGGGTTMNFDPRIGNAALPQGIYGAGNRAYVRDVQGSELAQNQVANITNQNSALMRNAAMQGNRRANARGNINSSMAAEAAQNAVIEAATPLALSDAQAYREAAGQNQQFLNQRDIADMQNQTQREGQWASIQGQLLANEGALQRQRENLAYSGEQAELARRYGFQIAGLENQFNTERDYRQNQFATDADYRQFGFENERSFRNFRLDQASADWNSNRARRNMIYSNVFMQNMDDPEGFDESINSGIMNYWNQWADSYMDMSFGNVYGY